MKKDYINGFSLLELLISMALVSIIFVTVGLIFKTTVEQTEFVTSNSELLSAVNEINKELEKGFYYSNDRNFGLTNIHTIIDGDSRNIKFVIFCETTAINPDTLTLAYKIKDSADGTNRKNLIVFYFDAAGIEKLISENTYKIDSSDTSRIIFTSIIPDIQYHVYYLPEYPGFAGSNQGIIEYKYSENLKRFLRCDVFGTEALPYTNARNYEKIENHLVSYCFKYKDISGNEYSAVNSALSDSITMISISYITSHKNNISDKIITERNIFIKSRMK